MDIDISKKGLKPSLELSMFPGKLNENVSSERRDAKGCIGIWLPFPGAPSVVVLAEEGDTIETEDWLVFEVCGPCTLVMRSDGSSYSTLRSLLAVDSSKYWKKSSNTRLFTSQYFCISFNPSKQIWALCSARVLAIFLDRCRLIVWIHRDEKRLVILIHALALYLCGVVSLTNAFDQIGSSPETTCLLLFLSRDKQLEAPTLRHDSCSHCGVPSMRFGIVVCKDDCIVSACWW